MDEGPERSPRSGRVAVEVLERPLEREERVRRAAFEHCSIAAPAPLTWLAAESRSNRVEGDVARDLEEVRVVLDQDGVEASLEEVPAGRMDVVESLRVSAVEALHANREISIPRLDEKVVVVWHQTVGMAAPAEPGGHVADHRQEPAVVAIVNEDGLLPVAPGSHVVQAAGDDYAWGSRHSPSIAWKAPGRARM